MTINSSIFYVKRVRLIVKFHNLFDGLLLIKLGGFKMAINKLTDYLDGKRIKYRTIVHSKAYTAQEIAHAAHVSGKELAKTVIVRINGELAMVVVPASYYVDLAKLKELIKADEVVLAHEEEFKYEFPDCELGAMPPFGNLYDLDVYVAEKLTEDEYIAFNACSHTQLIKMEYCEYSDLVKPKVLKIAHGV